MAKAKCYDCKWRGRVPGDVHSCCKHPSTGDALSDPLLSMLSVFVSVGRSAPQIGRAALELNIEADPHGIKNGWFNWPWNFDPAWLINCDGFEQKEG